MIYFFYILFVYIFILIKFLSGYLIDKKYIKLVIVTYLLGESLGNLTVFFGITKSSLYFLAIFRAMCQGFVMNLAGVANAYYFGRTHFAEI